MTENEFIKLQRDLLPKVKVAKDGQIRPAEEIIRMILDSPQQIKQNQNKFRKTGNEQFKSWQPLVVWQTSIIGDRVDA